MLLHFLIFLLLADINQGISSPILPFTTYNYSVELEANVADLWWTVDEIKQEITFELHIQTTGWIALGISSSGGMYGADIGIGWINQSGTVFFQDRYASTTAVPIIDGTTQDWFAIQGREQNGWTAIQFRRLYDTCDSMDVPIKSGTNILIYAYGLVDPNSDITYHETRRGSFVLSLRSYTSPTLESNFNQLEYFDFRLQNYVVPLEDTTYYCKIYKAPTNFTSKRHIIANKILLEPTNQNFIHHVLMYECDSIIQFNDSSLPEGLCHRMGREIQLCKVNVAVGWGVGGDYVTEYPAEAGYPIGGNVQIRYYLIETHFNNPNRVPNISGSSGIRFYIGNQLRQYDIGYLTFGTDIQAMSLIIPPQAENFIVDSYCPMNAHTNIPNIGISIISAFPHAHLHGRSISTKIIRNNTAIQYLFNAESFNFDYQFQTRFQKPIKLYPGDAFVTRCVYNTMDTMNVTLGGESVHNEMCLHIFAYYPRMDNHSICLNGISSSSWSTFLQRNLTSMSDYKNALSLVSQIDWTSQLTQKWQEFYYNASRTVIFGRGDNLRFDTIQPISQYKDLEEKSCNKTSIKNYATHPISNICMLWFFMAYCILFK